jgi:hypothetical protein
MEGPALPGIVATEAHEDAADFLPGGGLGFGGSEAPLEVGAETARHLVLTLDEWRCGWWPACCRR